MAYIAPSSEIYIIKNCPLDIGREHTIKFASVSAQEDYFFDATRSIHYLNQYTRINPLDNTIRVGLPYALVYQCNYVAFRNAYTLQEHKWYYGFITKVNYINEGTTEIEYSLDYMQTYLFDFEVLPCLVEREHTATDNVGENIVPEGLDIGEYVFNRNHKDFDNNLLNGDGAIDCEIGKQIIYIIITTVDVLYSFKDITQTSWQDIADFYPVGNMYNGVGVFVVEDAETLSHILLRLQPKIDSVAAVFPFPASLIDWNCVHWGNIGNNPYVRKAGRLYDDFGGTSVLPRSLESAVSYTDGQGTTHTVRSSISIPLFRNEQIDGYMPWNNKMFTAPFCWIELDSKTGTTALYRPEMFSTKINFGFMSSPSAEPVIFAYPRLYRGMDVVYEEGISKNNAYPYCPYQYDVFKVWLQENKASLALSFMQGVTESAIGVTQVAVGRTIETSGARQFSRKSDMWTQRKKQNGEFGKEQWSRTRLKGSSTDTDTTTSFNKSPWAKEFAAASGVLKCAGALASIADHSMVPDTVKGQVNNGSINQANNINDFYIYIKTLRRDYAQKIDDYFSRFGYAVNKFEVPNLFAQNGSPRRRWNYVKTVDAKIHSKSTTGFPLDVEENLEELFNNGITFWNIENGDMYDYSQTANNNNKPN